MFVIDIKASFSQINKCNNEKFKTHSSSVKIEYLGRTYFSDDSTAITRITPNGYAKYEKNGRSLIASRDGRGDITYQINGNEKQAQLSNADKIFLAQAVKDMIKRGHNND